jgi:hypothetical protein
MREIEIDVYWEEINVYWEVKMTFICEQILNPRITLKVNGVHGT